MEVRCKLQRRRHMVKKARVLSLKQAVKIFDTIGKSVPGLSKEYPNDLVSRGNKILILAFEVTNTITKGINLLQSLSKHNIQSLKETLGSEGVQCLISGDVKELLVIAASTKGSLIDKRKLFGGLKPENTHENQICSLFSCLCRMEFDVFLEELIRFGNQCKDSQWHSLGQYFSKLNSADSKHDSEREEAQASIGELRLLARYTSELYHEMNTLDQFEHYYKQKLEEGGILNLQQSGKELIMLHYEIKHQRKLIKILKGKSLW
ncbi:hypothetical protein SAY86_012462 [Trapa natans]|uniref:DUF3475 domain-containing protein n=1 Tax=Trapa natans TaxID=22666 RepID=A0AAN7MCQ6_TRANT|nr:hypothetical protein SAY86_012462 [Trapa natans]